LVRIKQRDIILVENRLGGRLGKYFAGCLAGAHQDGKARIEIVFEVSTGFAEKDIVDFDEITLTTRIRREHAVSCECQITCTNRLLAYT
jgi:hypothetical protein